MNQTHLDGPLPLSPEESDTIAFRVAARLRDEIVRLSLRPGDAISEGDIAERYGVSRQPVREAFIRLAQQGLLLIRPRRATVVKKISIVGVRQSRFIRESIEVEIARRAAGFSDDQTQGMFGALISRQIASAEAGDLNLFHTLDEQFHLTLARIARVEYAWRLIDDHKMQLDRVRFLTLPRASVDKTIAEHNRIVAAVASGSSADAESALRAHIERADELLIQAIEDWPDYFESSPDGL